MRVRKILKRKLLKALGNKLIALRVKTGRSQEDVAFSAGIDRSYYSALECGKRSPSIYCLYMVARELNVTLSELADFSVE